MSRDSNFVPLVWWISEPRRGRGRVAWQEGDEKSGNVVSQEVVSIEVPMCPLCLCGCISRK